MDGWRDKEGGRESERNEVCVKGQREDREVANGKEVKKR